MLRVIQGLILRGTSVKVLHVYVVVNFLSQVIFVKFLLFLRMVMYANEVETKEN